MGRDITFHAPPGQFVEVELDGETVVYEGDRHETAKWLTRLFSDVAGEPLLRDMTDEELQEVADAIAAAEYEPRLAEEYTFIEGPDDFEAVVTMFEAFAAAGATMTASY